ncbi:ATP-binding cassette domain-containing protein [Actinomadura yumaensis]
MFRRRYLLRLIVRRELRARYQGSLLGLGWSYVRPAAHFAVFFFVVGVFLGMSDRVAHFPIFMFSGLVLVSFFNETLINTTHSVIGNAPLVRKVYLPRELFPVASLLVSGVHLLPGLAIVLGVALAWGWTPSALAIGSALLGFSLVAVLGIGLGLLCSALHVFYRDTDKVVDIATLFVTWSVPMIYPWHVVRDTAPGWALDLYLANPSRTRCCCSSARSGGRPPTARSRSRRTSPATGWSPRPRRGAARLRAVRVRAAPAPLRGGAVTMPDAVPKAAVVVDAVTKRFTLRHARSIKNMTVRAVRREKLRERFVALEGVSAVIGVGESVALLGVNGSGKSTLLKIISGVMPPDGGSVRVRGRVAGLIEVGAGLHPDLTGRENVFLNGAILGMDREETLRKFDAIVEFADIGRFLDQPVRFYSSGMFMRLAFSIAVHTDPDVFLIDEVLAVGDPLFRDKCIQRLRAYRDSGRTMVIVAHDAKLLRQICTRGIFLENGRVVWDGDIDTAADLLIRKRQERRRAVQGGPGPVPAPPPRSAGAQS